MSRNGPLLHHGKSENSSCRGANRTDRETSVLRRRAPWQQRTTRPRRDSERSIATPGVVRWPLHVSQSRNINSATSFRDMTATCIPDCLKPGPAPCSVPISLRSLRSPHPPRGVMDGSGPQSRIPMRALSRLLPGWLVAPESLARCRARCDFIMEGHHESTGPRTQEGTPPDPSKLQPQTLRSR